MEHTKPISYKRRCLDARLAANEALRSFGLDTNSNYILLKSLIGGLEGCQDWDASFTEDHLQTCLALAGPHGYAVYKTLMIRKYHD